MAQRAEGFDDKKLVVLEGHLLKKNTKKNKLAKKYDKRYFELSEVTLSYAKDRKVLLDGRKDITVFEITDVVDVRQCDDPCKFVVEFPERTLKLAASDETEADRWVMKITEVVDSSENSTGNADGASRGRAGRGSADKPSGQSTALRGAHRVEEEEEEEEDEEPIPDAPAAIMPTKAPLPSIADLPAPKPSIKAETTVKKASGPPSPRSLLANPRKFASSFRVREEDSSDSEDEVEPAPGPSQGDAPPAVKPRPAEHDGALTLDDVPSPKDAVAARIAGLRVQEHLELSDGESPVTTPSRTAPVVPSSRLDAKPAAKPQQQDWLEEDWDSSESGEDEEDDDDDSFAPREESNEGGTSPPLGQNAANGGDGGLRPGGAGPGATFGNVKPDDGNWVEDDWDSDEE